MTVNSNSANKAVKIYELEQMLEDNPILAESFAEATSMLLSLRWEDEGWSPVNRLSHDDGFDLQSIKDIAEMADLQATGNPLLNHGFHLRSNDVFGRGVFFEPKPDKKMSERIQSVMERNDAVLFGEDGLKALCWEEYTKGNIFVAYDRDAESFFVIPLEEISGFASNPRSKSDVWYFQRSYTEIDPVTNKPKSAPTIEWYPVLERWESQSRKSPLSDRIDDKPVVPNIIIIDKRASKRVDRVWGIPEVLPAMPYAWAHAEYIKDASKLLKALATIAFKIVSKSKGNASNAGTTIRQPRQAGGTAAMTADTDIVPMAKAGQVDMKDGQTIASYVAAALQVSVVALLSDPSTATGGFGATAALDAPTASAARARQRSWTDFFKRIYRAAGYKYIEVNFPPIQEEPMYRLAQTYQMGHASGALHQDEYRAAFLDLTKIPQLHDEVPEPTVFTNAAQYSAEAIVADQQKQDAAAKAAANPQGVGVSDGVGASAGNNDLRDMSAKPGTGK